MRHLPIDFLLFQGNLTSRQFVLDLYLPVLANLNITEELRLAQPKILLRRLLSANKQAQPVSRFVFVVHRSSCALADSLPG